jgi:hypothetical protein
VGRKENHGSRRSPVINTMERNERVDRGIRASVRPALAAGSPYPFSLCLNYSFNSTIIQQLYCPMRGLVRPQITTKKHAIQSKTLKSYGSPDLQLPSIQVRTHLRTHAISSHAASRLYLACLHAGRKTTKPTMTHGPNFSSSSACSSAHFLVLAPSLPACPPALHFCSCA